VKGAAYIEHIKKRMSPGKFYSMLNNDFPFLSASQALRLEHLEIVFIRFLHLLAHHPDFAATEDELLDMASYVNTPFFPWPR